MKARLIPTPQELPRSPRTASPSPILGKLRPPAAQAAAASTRNQQQLEGTGYFLHRRFSSSQLGGLSRAHQATNLAIFPAPIGQETGEISPEFLPRFPTSKTTRSTMPRPSPKRQSISSQPRGVIGQVKGPRISPPHELSRSTITSPPSSFPIKIGHQQVHFLGKTSFH